MWTYAFKLGWGTATAFDKEHEKIMKETKALNLVSSSSPDCKNYYDELTAGYLELKENNEKLAYIDKLID